MDGLGQVLGIDRPLQLACFDRRLQHRPVTSNRIVRALGREDMEFRIAQLDHQKRKAVRQRVGVVDCPEPVEHCSVKGFDR